MSRAETVPNTHESSNLKVFFNTWELDELLSPLLSQDVNISEQQKTELEPVFWHSVCTEYDSKNFFEKMLSTKTCWSTGFIEFVYYWLRDERKHALGFAKIYSLIYGESVSSIYQRLEKRPVNFSPIENFFSDELNLCLLLAYDEIVTTHVYHRAIPFYQELNRPILGEWIRRLKADEALHFSNLIRHVRLQFADRLNEVPGMLQDILKADKESSAYGATFVLDHDCDDFSLSDAELETLCIDLISEKLRRDFAS